MRKTAYVVAAIFVLLALAILLVPRIVSLESFRPKAVAILQEKTGRKVGLGRIALSLFPAIGVKVSDVSLSGDARHPGETLLAIPEAEVRLAILPLFSGRAELTRVILRRPKVLFRRYADGTHSASDILARLEGPKEAAPAAAPPGKEPAVALRSVFLDGAALSLRVEGKDGTESTWDIDPLTVRLAGIDGRKKEFRVETRIDGVVKGDIVFTGEMVPRKEGGSAVGAHEIKGDGKIFGQKLFVEGTTNPSGEATEVDIRARMPKVDLGEVRRIFRDPPSLLTEMKPEGYAALSARATGPLETLAFRAEADLGRAAWTLPGDLRKAADAPCTVVVEGRRSPDRLSVTKAELKAPPLTANATATLGPKEGQLEWAGSAAVSSLAELAKGSSEVGSFSPTGRVTASGKGSRAASAAPHLYDVGVVLAAVGLRIPERKLELRGLDGRVDLSPERLAFSPLTGHVNGQRFTLRGSVAMGKSPAGQLDLKMPYLDVDALLPPAGDAKKEEKKKAPSEEAKREIAARLSLGIDAGKAKGIEFSDLKGIVRYEKETLFLDDVTATLYGGTAAVTGRIGLAEATPDLKVKVALKEVEAGEILARKTTLKDLLSGAVSLSAEVGGGTKDFADFTRTAAGSGSVRIAGGRIRGVDLLAAAAGAAGVKGLIPDAAPARSGAGGETAFRDLSADFRIEGGKIRTDALKLVSDRMGLEGAAALGFDRTIDFRGTLTLPKGMSDRVRGVAGKFLVGPGGRVAIPLVLSGPVNAPAVRIDAEALARGAAERAIRDATERIPGLAPPPAKSPPGEPAGEKAPPEEKKKGVERLLDRFLPKK